MLIALLRKAGRFVVEYTCPHTYASGMAVQT
jgi:hypothetical protein